MQADLIADSINLLYREAACLDRRQWQQWLDLYVEDAEFWIPAWDSEHCLTNDPLSELSLIYYNGRAGLEDRIWRIESGVSSASSPLPRTCHFITNVQVENASGDVIQLYANWQVHSFFVREEQTISYYGFYEHTLKQVGSTVRITRKKIVVLNDVMSRMLDIYMV
jgi:3-phenylpropionate/cinnamic acid dioxygenase small subunit